jgi:hypothetical protein
MRHNYKTEQRYKPHSKTQQLLFLRDPQPGQPIYRCEPKIQGIAEPNQPQAERPPKTRDSSPCVCEEIEPFEIV